MDSFAAMWLAIIVLLAPLVGAAIAAVASGPLYHRLAPLSVQCGSAISLCGAAVALWQSLVLGQPSQRVSLGTWLAADPVNVLSIPLALKLDVVAAGLIALACLATFCGVACTRRAMEKDGPAPLFYCALSVLLFSAIGVVASTNLGELFVFWQIGGLTSYVLWAAQPSATGGAVKKLVLIQRVGDFLLLPALLILAGGLGTLEFDDVFGPGLFGSVGRWNGFAAHNPALVELIALCLFGACVARCGLFPLFGWIDDLGGAPPIVQIMLQGSCLAPCGAVLLMRCQPVLSDAMATARFASFVCGASVFVMGACASATRDWARVAAFGCGGTLALVMLGLATGSPLSAATALVLLAVLIPGSTAVMLATGNAGSGDRTATPLRWPVVLLSFAAVAAGAAAAAFLSEQHLFSVRRPINAGALAVGGLMAIAGLALAASRIWGRSPNSVAQPHDGTFLRLGQNRFYCDSFLFLSIALPVRAAAQFARFLDWFLIDGLVSQTPAQLAEAAGGSFEPIQRRPVSFYVLSMLVGTGMLGVVIISLRGSW